MISSRYCYVTFLNTLIFWKCPLHSFPIYVHSTDIHIIFLPSLSFLPNFSLHYSYSLFLSEHQFLGWDSLSPFYISFSILNINPSHLNKPCLVSITLVRSFFSQFITVSPLWLGAAFSASFHWPQTIESPQPPYLETPLSFPALLHTMFFWKKKRLLPSFLPTLVSVKSHWCFTILTLPSHNLHYSLALLFPPSLLEFSSCHKISLPALSCAACVPRGTGSRMRFSV